MNIMLASCIALVSSLILTVIFIPLLIRFMRSHHEGQEIRDEGPKWHQKNLVRQLWEEQFSLSLLVFPLFGLLHGNII